MADEIIIENEPKNEPETKGAENSEIERLKAALAKANSEAGNYRKQLRERQTAEEAAAAERAEKEAERDAHNGKQTVVRIFSFNYCEKFASRPTDEYRGDEEKNGFHQNYPRIFRLSAFLAAHADNDGKNNDPDNVVEDRRCYDGRTDL